MPSMETERGTKWLSTGGVRPTRQRVALASLLVGDGKNRHVTAESLFAAAQDTGEQVSLATVSERQGRVIDRDEAGSMEKKKVEGYF